MSAIDPYSAPSSIDQVIYATGDGTVNVPPHAEEFVASLRKGSPMIKGIVLHAIGVVFYVVGCWDFLLFSIQELRHPGSNEPPELAWGMLMIVPAMALFLWGMVYFVQFTYRFAALLHLDERSPGMTPTLMTVLCFVPCVSIAGVLIFLLKTKQHYPRILEINGIKDAPLISSGLLMTMIICYAGGIIPFLGMLLLLPLLVVSLILGLRMHQALNYFASRV